MVSSSKILTVSYGTFSCTAEGFDDPLAVVKDTTHFFRGVVNADRFFGAEPPQFDAELATEMMRERLAAEGREGTLTLGSAAAASSGALAAALAAGPARAMARQPETAPETFDDDRDSAGLLPDDDTIEATAVLTERTVDLDETDMTGAASGIMDDTAGSPAPEVSAPAPRTSTSASVAAKLDRIRAVVASTAAAGAARSAAAAQETPDEETTDAAESVTGFEDEPAFVSDVELEDQLEAEETPDTADAADDVPAIAGDDTAHVDETATVDTTDDLTTARPDDLSQPAHAEAETDEDFGDDTDDDALSALLGELESDSRDSSVFSDKSLSDDMSGAPVSEPMDDSAFADSIASLLGETEEDDDETLVADASIAATLAGLEDDTHEDAAVSTEEDAPYDEADDTERHDTDFAADEAEDDIARDAPYLNPDVDNVFAEDMTDAPDASPTPQPRARVVKVKRADFLRAVEAGQFEEVQDEDDSAVVAPAAVPMADLSTLTPEEEDELARELAAVKAELAGEFDNWDDKDDSAPLAAAAPVEDEDGTWDAPYGTSVATEDAAYAEEDDETYLDDDDAMDDEEDDDQPRATAPLRLDNPVSTPDALDDGDADEDSVSALIRDTARKTVKMASPARALLTEREVEDDDTLRLMDQTDTEMKEPEGSRRRTAIAHLRAAVAATKADRLLGRRADAAEEQEPYREDLANVVRPRRPQAAAPRTERPAEVAPVTRPAPLKLVAEQRVEDRTDGTTHAPAELPRTVPVRPRRVRRVADLPPQDDMAEDAASADGFVAYAEKVGASDLPELLEAAAAYMAYVEGRDQFSRPQLMSTVRMAEASESSREDRLRSFGQLLREGKIKKTAGGRFTASERISFKPDRAAG
ncbi:hypothetical protein [Sagittula stellata]|uniref:Lipoprotein, putative n=1 Tax=Sagittula stellata (strain ATCC 700073 / DSM 11524 / E-37) TaxID=388399 RepID=A3K0G2_SAGS3|nr:hypothetical protein [Sagittula stellata]EBA09277.1 lipoprotein, putative [Sagittula stellata E-37]